MKEAIPEMLSNIFHKNFPSSSLNCFLLHAFINLFL